MSDSSSFCDSSSISGLSLASDELHIVRLASELEAKVAELKTDIHPELGPFLVRYGDALLTKEEDNLNPTVGEEAAEGEAADVSGGDPSDIQVAWECLEQARLCFEQSEDSAAVRYEFAFVHQRLGDLLTMQSAVDAASEEYRKALSFLASDAHRKRAGVLMTLGQVLLMAQKYEEGQNFYVQAEGAFAAWKAATKDATDVEIIQASMAEVHDALKDCRVAIQAEKSAKATVVDAKIETDVTGGFDKASTDQPTKPVITLVPKRKTAEDDPDAKKPRLA
jgi:hypothetical protein